MGTNYIFRCDSCDYIAEISGGKDYGSFAVVRTMTCNNCNELVDVLIGAYGKEGPSEIKELNERMDLCPKCEGTDVVRWDDEKPCPKCDGKMIRGKEASLWD